MIGDPRGTFMFEHARGVRLDALRALLERYLARTSLDEATPQRFAFDGPLIGIRGVAREGVIETLELQVLASVADATEEQRDQAASALSALGFGFGMRLRLANAELLDLGDEVAVRAWLGAVPLPTSVEALELVRAALSRGERPSDRALLLAAGEDAFEDLLDALARTAPHAAGAASGQVPVATRDRRALAAFSMSFDGYVTLGPALASYANAALRRFRDRRTLPRSVTGARACLFFECRRRVHQARDPDDADWLYIDGLLAVVAAGARR